MIDLEAFIRYACICLLLCCPNRSRLPTDYSLFLFGSVLANEISKLEAAFASRLLLSYIIPYAALLTLGSVVFLMSWFPRSQYHL